MPSMQINAGVDMAIDPSSEDVEQVLKDATGGLGVDVAIETSAVYQALDQAIRGLAFNGTVAVAGWAKECTGGLDLGAVAHFSIPNLIFARANSDPNRDHLVGISLEFATTVGNGYRPEKSIVRRLCPLLFHLPRQSKHIKRWTYIRNEVSSLESRLGMDDRNWWANSYPYQ